MKHENMVINDFYFLNSMEEYLKNEGKLSPTTQAAEDRKNGKILTFSTHIKYMIHAQLSNQEKWSLVERHISKIDDIFFQYDIKLIKQKIKDESWQYFFKKVKPCLTRGVSLEGQMKNLEKNINTMESLNNSYKNGGLDSYVVSRPPREIIINFTKKHKLQYMGISLICEYLKNVGVECAKPDTHIMRFLSRTRRGYLPKDEARLSKKKLEDNNWTDADKILALEIIENMGKETNKTPSEIDRIIWSYCADNYGEICTKIPNCELCKVRSGCNRIKPNIGYIYFKS